MQNVKLIGTDKQVAWAEKIRKEHAFAIRSAKKLMQDIIPRTPEGGKMPLYWRALRPESRQPSKLSKLELCVQLV